MKILEILLPKSADNRSLTGHAIRKIDALQKRMTLYVDKIMDPLTSTAGKEFLKDRLRVDHGELSQLIADSVVNEDADAAVPVETFEIYDRRTGLRAGGPYSTRVRASRAADKKDLAYGAIRYGWRRIPAPLKEAVHKLPLTHNDFELVKTLMNNPIPAAIAPIYIHRIIEDDELDDQIKSLEDSAPNRDIRPLIYEWFNRVMPDQMYRFRDDSQSTAQKEGILSLIHGYDPHMYKGSNDPITGNAYGRA